MTGPENSAFKSYSSEGERLIHAFEGSEDGKGYALTSFPVSSVERIKKVSEGRSVLILGSGLRISVALSHEVLEQKIYRPDFKTDDMGILDVTGLTGGAAVFTIDGNSFTAYPGTQMPDDTIYLGCFENKDWFVTAEDAKNSEGQRLSLNFNEAAELAKALKEHGHTDWMMPDLSILQEMFKNKAKGAFNGTYNESSNIVSRYWTSHQDRATDYVFDVSFFDGNLQCYNLGRERPDRSIRPVRMEPRL